MPLDNAAIARVFSEMADISDIMGENAFKGRAFRKAAEEIEAHPSDIAALALERPEALREIPGIGEKIAHKIVELATSGRCAEHEEMLAERPRTLLELLALEGVGPKKVKLFFEELGVRSLDDLEAAAKSGRVRALPRMSEKLEQKLLRSIAEVRMRAGRVRLMDAEPVVERLAAMLRAVPGVRKVEPAGSFRRRRETVGDVDLLCVAEDPAAAIERFAKAGETLGRGETRCSVRLSSGIQADLRVVPAESFGAALHYFTGSKAHNVALRGRARERGLTVNEYGVFELLPSGEAGRRVAGASEEEVFAAVGLPWIPPELREDRGEIALAERGALPRLIALEDIRGDVHMHTTASDGTASIEEMAAAALARGRRYIAITDHSKSLTVARGLDEARVRAQGKAIREAQRAFEGALRIFHGSEVDILRDGALDLDDECLDELDVVVASVHSHFHLEREEMTARVLRAIESGRVDVVGHPTGRLLLRRDPFPLDMERVMRAAAARGVALEASASPERLDLNDVHLRMAKEHGVKVVVNTDAHAEEQMDNIRFGIGNLRRAAYEAKDVLNTLDADAFIRRLHEGHRKR
jgi:DNA polymerase (family 10)